MSALPSAAFPMAAKASGASTFAVAVLIGLALYLSASSQPKTPSQTATR